LSGAFRTSSAIQGESYSPVGRAGV
jgi:hypothetical protein